MPSTKIIPNSKSNKPKNTKPHIRPLTKRTPAAPVMSLAGLAFRALRTNTHDLRRKFGQLINSQIEPLEEFLKRKGGELYKWGIKSYGKANEIKKTAEQKIAQHQNISISSESESTFDKYTYQPKFFIELFKKLLPQNLKTSTTNEDIFNSIEFKESLRQFTTTIKKVMNDFFSDEEKMKDINLFLEEAWNIYETKYYQMANLWNLVFKNDVNSTFISTVANDSLELIKKSHKLYYDNIYFETINFLSFFNIITEDKIREFSELKIKFKEKLMDNFIKINEVNNEYQQLLEQIKNNINPEATSELKYHQKFDINIETLLKLLDQNQKLLTGYQNDLLHELQLTDNINDNFSLNQRIKKIRNIFLKNLLAEDINSIFENIIELTTIIKTDILTIIRLDNYVFPNSIEAEEDSEGLTPNEILSQWFEDKFINIIKKIQFINHTIKKNSREFFNKFNSQWIYQFKIPDNMYDESAAIDDTEKEIQLFNENTVQKVKEEITNIAEEINQVFTICEELIIRIKDPSDKTEVLKNLPQLKNWINNYVNKLQNSNKLFENVKQLSQKLHQLRKNPEQQAILFIFNFVNSRKWYDSFDYWEINFEQPLLDFANQTEISQFLNAEEERLANNSTILIPAITYEVRSKTYAYFDNKRIEFANQTETLEELQNNIKNSEFVTLEDLIDFITNKDFIKGSITYLINNINAFYQIIYQSIIKEAKINDLRRILEPEVNTIEWERIWKVILDHNQFARELLLRKNKILKDLKEIEQKVKLKIIDFNPLNHDLRQCIFTAYSIASETVILINSVINHWNKNEIEFTKLKDILENYHPEVVEQDEEFYTETYIVNKPDTIEKTLAQRLHQYFSDSFYKLSTSQINLLNKIKIDIGDSFTELTTLQTRENDDLLSDLNSLTVTSFDLFNIVENSLLLPSEINSLERLFKQQFDATYFQNPDSQANVILKNFRDHNERIKTLLAKKEIYLNQLDDSYQELNELDLDSSPARFKELLRLKLETEIIPLTLQIFEFINVLQNNWNPMTTQITKALTMIEYYYSNEINIEDMQSDQWNPIISEEFFEKEDKPKKITESNTKSNTISFFNPTISEGIREEITTRGIFKPSLADNSTSILNYTASNETLVFSSLKVLGIIVGSIGIAGLGFFGWKKINKKQNRRSKNKDSKINKKDDLKIDKATPLKPDTNNEKEQVLSEEENPLIPVPTVVKFIKIVEEQKTPLTRNEEDFSHC